MKFCNIALLFVVFAFFCSLSATLAQDDSAGVKRPALRRPAGKSVKTTTAAPPPKEEDVDYGDENQDQYGDEGEDGAAPSSTTTTTEVPKKVIGPVIRPFRSNDDFLTSLKRRQMDAKKNRAEHKAPAPKIKSSAPAEEEGGDEDSGAAPAPAKAFKGGNPALNRRKLAKPGKSEPAPAADDAAAEESEQQQKEDTKTKRLPHGRLALRKRN